MQQQHHEVIIYCLRLMQRHWSPSMIFVWLSPWSATRAPPRQEPWVFPCEGSNKQHPPSPPWSYEPCKMTIINNLLITNLNQDCKIYALFRYSGWKDFCYAKSIESFPFTPTKNIFLPRMTKCRNAKNVPEDEFIPTFLLLVYELDSKWNLRFIIPSCCCISIARTKNRFEYSLQSVPYFEFKGLLWSQ